MKRKNNRPRGKPRGIPPEIIKNTMPRHRIVQLVFALFSFALSFLTWHYVSNSIDITAGIDLAQITALIILSIAIFLLAIVIFQTRIVLLIYGAFLIGFIIFAGARWEYLAGVLASFFLLAVAVMRAKRQMGNQVVFGFYHFSRYGAPQILTALALLFALTGYFYPFNFATIQLPAGLFKSVTPIVEAIAGSLVPNYQKGITVDQFLSSGVNDALNEIKNDKQRAAVSATIDQQIRKQKDDLSEQIGVKLTGQETLPDITQSVTNMYLSRYLIRYKDVAPIAIAVLMFLTIKSFGFAIDRIAVLFAWIFARILLASNIIRKQKITVDKEILTI